VDEFLETFIFSITIGILFITIIDLVLPNNNTKKYINMVCGLILMMLIFSPIVRLFSKAKDDIGSFKFDFEYNELFALNEREESYSNYFFNEYYESGQNSN